MTKTSFPVVGVGASAGGLEAFEEFIRAIPEGSGAAFVLIQHLEPTHPSLLTTLVARWTELPVTEAEDGVAVLADHIYVIPPGQYLTLAEGHLYTLPRQRSERSVRLPIDVFFRSLAHDCAELGAGVVLSGAGSDGTLGLADIHAAGGLTMVQDPCGAAYDSMPRNALQTGLIDYTLEPGQMPGQLAAHFGGDRVRLRISRAKASKTSYAKALLLLRDHTGHDFSGYKDNTVGRRIERRMMVNRVDSPDDYLLFLQSHPHELERLHRELLIGVTSFFRNPEAFAAVEKSVLPALIHPDRSATDPVRIWVVGCSTGEEVYSLAILAQERLESLDRRLRLALFASDIDHDALQRAREGEYPTGIALDVSEARLNKFFQKGEGGYRVKPLLREPIVFSEHSVIKDAPFSHLDLISCRNLLIYLRPDLQQKVIELFHYALKPEGYLFLGNSESVGGCEHLFRPIDKKWKIYQRVGDASVRAALTLIPRQRTAVAMATRKVPTKRPLRELLERKLLTRHCPPALVVDARGEILYTHGMTAPFLEPLRGKTDLHLLNMTREELRPEMMSIVTRVRADGRPLTSRSVYLVSGGLSQRVRVTVEPLEDEDELPATRLLILFQSEPARTEVEVLAPHGHERLEAAGADQLLELEKELHATREYLRTTIEELETTNEELQSTNEELQSANEELQSTVEELETSREELQSVNEELITLNSELQTKIEESTRSNDDLSNLLSNLLSSLEIAVVFLDNELRITRYTPAAGRVIHLIPADQGRHFGDITSRLDFSQQRLVAEVEGVLRTLSSRHREVQDRDGLWYAMSILPYRTSGNVIEGVVLTFLNITSQKQVQEGLRVHSLTVENSPAATLLTDAEGIVLYANPAAAVNWPVGCRPPFVEHPLEDFWATLRAGDTWKQDYFHSGPDGTLQRWSLDVTAVGREGGEPSGLVAVLVDPEGQRHQSHPHRALIQARGLQKVLARLALAIARGCPQQELTEQLCGWLTEEAGYAWSELELSPKGPESRFRAGPELHWQGRLLAPLVRRQNDQSSVALPLTYQDTLLGVLRLGDATPDAFEQGEVEQLMDLADILATLLQAPPGEPDSQPL
ncbi:MAG: chemotaxis protein CheB [Vulcanimicrobiota bacterium]